jgi:hypothetical protein
MWAVGIERGAPAAVATVPTSLQYRGTVHTREGDPASRAAVTAGTVHVREGEARRLRLRGAGNAGRGASPTAGKREGFSF